MTLFYPTFFIALCSNNVVVDPILLESSLMLGSISFITFTDVADLEIKDHELIT